MITGIVVALAEELGTITARADRSSKGVVNRINDKLWVVYSGAGSENARIASELLVNSGVKQLVSWGCATALNATLNPGDLVLATSYVGSDCNEFAVNNKDWLAKVQAVLSANFSLRFGKIAESKTIVETSNAKVEIGAETGAIALDMESVAIARVAQSSGIPFLTIRAIADSSSLNMPKAVSCSLNTQGDVVLTKLFRYLATHPGELPDLVNLGISFGKARKTLKDVSKQIDGLLYCSA